MMPRYVHAFLTYVFIILTVFFGISLVKALKYLREPTIITTTCPECGGECTITAHGPNFDLYKNKSHGKLLGHAEAQCHSCGWGIDTIGTDRGSCIEFVINRIMHKKLKSIEQDNIVKGHGAVTASN